MNSDHASAMRRVAAAAGVEPDEVDRALTRTASPKLREFDEPKARQLIQTMANQVTSTMTLLGMGTNGRKLLVSSLPSSSVNAFCCANTWDDEYHHVFVDSDLIIFCASLAKIVANCFTRGVLANDRIDFTSRRIVANARARDIEQRTEDLFSSAMFVGTVRASKPWLPDPEALRLQAQLTEAMERFVVAHELAHLALGHLDSAAETVSLAPAGFEDAEAVVFSHQAEFEADGVGSILATEAAVRSGKQNVLIPIAPYIFLKGVEVIDACDALIERKHAGMNATHPPAAERSACLRAVMIRHIGHQDPEGNLPQALARVDQLFYWLGKIAQRGIAKGVAYGLKPREREGLRLFEAGGRPKILGLRVSAEEVERKYEEVARRSNASEVDAAPVRSDA